MSIASAIGPLVVIYLLHVALSRKNPQINHDKLTVVLYLIFPVLLFCLFLAATNFFITELPATLEGEITVSFLLYLAFASAFVASFPAIYADCPTLIIAYLVKDSSHFGVTKKQMELTLRLTENSVQLIAKAEEESLIRRYGKTLQLTAFGSVVAFLFWIYRRALGLQSQTL